MARNHRSRWRRLLALWRHRDNILNLLNQFAHGPADEFVGVVEQYGGHANWARRLHSQLQELAL